MERLFKDRRAAGRVLAEALQEYREEEGLLVLALPRGGVPVGYEVAKALGAELDVLIVRKLGVPNQPELAMGAIASGGASYLNDSIIGLSGVSPRAIEAVLEQERHELARREMQYRGARSAAEIQGRTVIVVDDGIATGASMQAAILALRANKPGRIVVAAPVAPAGTQREFKGLADAFVCVLNPHNFGAVGQFYEEFEQVGDEEVRSLLAKARY